MLWHAILEMQRLHDAQMTSHEAQMATMTTLLDQQIPRQTPNLGPAGCSPSEVFMAPPVAGGQLTMVTAPAARLGAAKTPSAAVRKGATAAPFL